MPYKFKVGDRVKVAKILSEGTAYDKHLGRIGHVFDVSPPIWPYAVRFHDGKRCVFQARELTAAPAKKRRKKRGK